MHRCLPWVIGVLSLTIAACHRQSPMVETALYFGLSQTDGDTIADSSWQRFEQEEVIRVFPNGFTVIPANGVWKGKPGMVSEKTRVVVSLNRMEDSLSENIDSLRQRYKSKFRQESVMRVDQEVERWDF